MLRVRRVNVKKRGDRTRFRQHMSALVQAARKMGATKDGKFVAGFAELKYQAGAFPGSPVQPGVMCAYAPYDIATESCSSGGRSR